VDLESCGVSSSVLEAVLKVAGLASLVFTCVAVGILFLPFGAVVCGCSNQTRLVLDSLVAGVFCCVLGLCLYGLTVTFPITLYDVTVYFTVMSAKETYESLGLCTLDITQAKAVVAGVGIYFSLSCIILWQSISRSASTYVEQNMQSAAVTGLAQIQRL